MHSQASHRLKKVIATHGLAIVRDPQRVEDVLHTALGRDSKAVFLLVTTLRAGVVTQLLSVAPDTPIDETIDRLAHRLHKSRALVKDSARWAVAFWATALGLVEPVDEPCPVDSEAPIEIVQASDGPPTVEIAKTPESGRFACPNCKTPLITRASKRESEPVECPCCFWRFEIHGPTGEVIEDGEVKTTCPYKDCGIGVVIRGGDEIRCRGCKREFLIDGHGKLRGFPIRCSTCDGELSRISGHDLISCSGCASKRGAGDDATIEVSCPLCNRVANHRLPGAVKCRKCWLQIVIDAYGNIVEHPPIGKCPHCKRKYRDRPGIELCPRCGHRLNEKRGTAMS